MIITASPHLTFREGKGERQKYEQCQNEIKERDRRAESMQDSNERMVDRRMTLGERKKKMRVMKNGSANFFFFFSPGLSNQSLLILALPQTSHQFKPDLLSSWINILHCLFDVFPVFF